MNQIAVEQVKEMQDKRFDVLRMIYELLEETGDVTIPIWWISIFLYTRKSLRLEEPLFAKIIEYLRDAGLVEVFAGDPWESFERGRILIKREGIDEVERRLLHPDKPSQYFPALGAETEETPAGPRGKPGHPGLDHDELIYRLAKAQEAEEIRSENPDMTWKEIAKDIDWRHGTNEPGLALLRDARLSRLGRLKKDDPHGLLQEVARWRKEEEARKTKKT